MPPRLAYTLFMVLAFGVFLLSRHLLPRPRDLARLPLWKRAALVLAGFVGGALGGKAPFALAAADRPWTAAAWVSDGKTIVAALLGAYLAVEAAKLVLGVRVKTGDTYALPMALGLAVGRWGCFFNGCCYGVETGLPWAVDFGDGLRRHPTQVYEVLFHLFMAVVLWQLLRTGALRYQRLKLYLIAYGVYRFATEFIRPEPPWRLGLTFYQWGALVLVATMAAQWVWDERLKRREEEAAAELASVVGTGWSS